MSIDWGALGTVAAVSAAFGIGIVVVFSIGLLGLSAAEGRTTDEGGAGLSRGPGFALAGLAGLVCLAAVAFGVYLIAA